MSNAVAVDDGVPKLEDPCQVRCEAVRVPPCASALAPLRVILCAWPHACMRMHRQCARTHAHAHARAGFLGDRHVPLDAAAAPPHHLGCGGPGKRRALPRQPPPRGAGLMWHARLPLVHPVMRSSRASVPAAASLLADSLPSLPFAMACAQGGVQSFLTAPLVASNGHRLGAICITDTKQHKWTAGGCHLLPSVAIWLPSASQTPSSTSGQQVVGHAAAEVPHASVPACKCASMQVCQHASVPACKCASMQVCQHASLTACRLHLHLLATWSVGAGVLLGACKLLYTRRRMGCSRWVLASCAASHPS